MLEDVLDSLGGDFNRGNSAKVLSDLKKKTLSTFSVDNSVDEVVKAAVIPL